MMTPGQYLALRRRAAGLSIEDVAAAVTTAPPLGEIDRTSWLRRIEEGVVPIGRDVRFALGRVFSFSSVVLTRLSERSGHVPRLCLICGCSEHDPCIGKHGVTCAWWGPDSCTFCTLPPQEKVA